MFDIEFPGEIIPAGEPSGELANRRAILRRCRLLDPRPADVAQATPIANAVNIPYGELPGRVWELPPHGELVIMPDVDGAAEAAAWLRESGRSVVRLQDYEMDMSAPNEVGRLWKPNAFLEELIPTLQAGRALDLACGAGRESVYLSSLGWRVEGCDVRSDALERAQQLERSCAGACEPIEWKLADVEAPNFAPNGQFDLIIMFRFLHRPLFERLAEWLCPHGSLVCETFTTTHRERHGKPLKDRFVLLPGEYQRLVKGLCIRHHSEDWRGESHTARLWAMR